MENSFIKLYRSTLEWEWYKDSKMVHLFIHLLLKANFTDGKFQGIDIKRGQLIIGLNSLSETLGVSTQSLRTCLKKLISTGEITTKSTNRFSLITIVKYDTYQSYDIKTKRKSTNNSTNEQQSINNQSTTIEESNKENNIPDELEFLEYCKTITEFNFKGYEYSLKSKYNTWVDNGWKDGNGEKIKNWKLKIKNTYPYLKPTQQKPNYHNLQGTI